MFTPLFLPEFKKQLTMKNNNIDSEDEMDKNVN